MSSFSQLLSQLLNTIKPVQQLPPPGQSPPAPGLPFAQQKDYPSLYGTDIQDLMSHMGRGENQGPAAEVPTGPLQTTAQHLLPQQFGYLGATRPLGPEEYVQTPQGYASEEDYTIPVDKTGNPVVAKKADHWRVVPGLWLKNGVPTHVTEDEAGNLAQHSGLTWPEFPTEEAANRNYVNPRESIWESQKNMNTATQPPIWRYHAINRGPNRQNPDEMFTPAENFARYQQFAKPGPYQTKLTPSQEMDFFPWLVHNAPYNYTTYLRNDSPYDMRGYWQALTSGNPRAVSMINQYDQLRHFPDIWKTPYDALFSNESIYSTPNAPRWTPNDNYVTPNGQVIFEGGNKGRWYGMPK